VLDVWLARKDSNLQSPDPESAPGRPQRSAKVRLAFYFTRKWRSICPLPSGAIQGYPQTICCQIYCQNQHALPLLQNCRGGVAPATASRPGITNPFLALPGLPLLAR